MLDYSFKEPFMSFVQTQSDSLTSFKEMGAHIFGRNTIIIATPNYLFGQKKRI